MYEELELISIKYFEYLDGKYVAMNCTLVDLCKTSRSVDVILDLKLPSSIGFLTNMVKLDAKNIVAYLFENKSSVLINERDFGIFMLDGIRIDLHSSSPGRLITYRTEEGSILTDTRPISKNASVIGIRMCFACNRNNWSSTILF